MINVAVIPGWGGGAWHVRNFVAALKVSGFEVTDAARADIIIAHSVACQDLPKKTPAVLYVLIDPPYWPGETIIKRFLTHVRNGSPTAMKGQGFTYRFQELFWRAVYLIAKPNYTAMVLKNSSGMEFLEEIKDKNVWIIRNQNDPYCSPDIQLPISSSKRVSLINLPGEHDDYYFNPQPYIGLLPKQI